MRQNNVRPARFRFNKGGRAGKMGGGMSTARKDMESGFYKDDMGREADLCIKKVALLKRKNKVTKIEKMSLSL